MATATAADRVKCEINNALDNVRAEIDRIEILAAALAAFARPIPEYESGFQHLRHLTVHAQELGQPASGD
ncbi:MAG TPA: hypothetical protein VGJ01_23100 [Pseudolabrys sp.]|jgi:hypothetical protein